MGTKGTILIGGIVFLGLLAVAIIMAFFTLQPAQASPGILYVAPTGDCGGVIPCYNNIQTAIDVALAGDEIRIAAGMYIISPGDHQVVYLAKNLALRGGYTTTDWNSPDPVANPTLLNALSQGRVMVITGTHDATIQGLQLVYGNAAGLGGYDIGYTNHDAGGGLFINNAVVTLDQTWVLTNTTPDNGYGGGIYSVYSSLVLGNGTTIQANIGGAGGGLYLNHTQASLSQVTIHDNQAGGPWSGISHGGGGMNIVADSQVEITDSTIRGNRKLITTFGAGILFQGGHLVIKDSLIEGNKGTAVQMISYIPGSGAATAILSNNVIQNNDGTGVNASSLPGHPTITMTGNLVQGNHTDGWAGGVTLDTDALLVGNTFLDNYTGGNSSFKGGGVYLKGDQNHPILFKANLVKGNRSSIASGAKGGGIYVEGENVILDGNIIQGNTANEGAIVGSGSGGGIYIAGDAVLLNNIITDNSVGGAGGSGAGLTVAGSQPILYHNTIARNMGGANDGIYVTEAGEVGLPVLYNTIIADQTYGVRVDGDPPGNLATLYGVLWWNNVNNITGAAFAFDETTGNPIFVDPDGGDYHISFGSAAIDNGVTVGVDSDMDADYRPHYAGYDLGADEWSPLVGVKSISSTTAEPGQVLTYTLTLDNMTTTTMTVRLTDTLPAEVGFLGPLSFNHGNGSYASGVITWAGEVPTTTSTLITWAVEVLPSVSGGTTITNTATISDDYGLFQTNPVVVVVSQHNYMISLPFILRQ